jgi:hypothetical protein
MKKVLLALLLLVLIVAVSYVKTIRENQRSEAYYDEGKMEAARDADKRQQEADSLRFAMAEQQLTLTDSLLKKDVTYRSIIDSLENVVDQQQKTISSKSPELTPAIQRVKQSSEMTVSKHEQIVKYYKRRFANLPKDLSDYEKRIAINEIREETSQKFSISLQELKKIREKYKLAY